MTRRNALSAPDLLPGGDDGDARPSLRSYAEPWYRALPNAVTDWWYGPEATAQQAAGTDGGTHNYVVFDDSIIEILRKYGLVPPLVAGGAAAVSQDDAQVMR